MPLVQGIVMSTSAARPLEERIEEALDQIRPAIAADGGEVWLSEIEGDTVYVAMLGACGDCAMSRQTLKLGIERAIKERCPEIHAVEQI